MKNFAGLVTALLAAGTGVLATPTPSGVASAAAAAAAPAKDSPPPTPSGDIVGTQTTEDGWVINWYGNATQEALIADALANKKSLATLDFLAEDPAVNPDAAAALSKRQCGSSGIDCYDQNGVTAPYTACQKVLGYINDNKWNTLPLFPHAVCATSFGWYSQCCVSWSHPVLGYIGDLQFPAYVTYNTCELPDMAGRFKGYIMGGVCQNICMAYNDNPSFCGSP